MRQQVRSRSTFYVKRTANDPRAQWDLAQIQEAFRDYTTHSRQLQDSIIRSSACIKETRPYWMARRAELQAMVRNVGCPDLFITFSAADLHWDSFFSHSSEYDSWKEAVGSDKFRIVRLALRDNPHIAAHDFYARFNAFMELFLKPNFADSDYWTWYVIIFYFLVFISTSKLIFILIFDLSGNPVALLICMDFYG